MKICRTCKTEYKPSSGHLDCPRCRGKKAKKGKCSVCGMKTSDPKYKLCPVCLGKKQTGIGSPVWKGGKAKHSNGYVMIVNKNHPRSSSSGGYVFEHILVMEEMIGRYVERGETIHHKNGVRDDNRPENLELWISNHPSGQRVSDLVAWAKEILEKYGDKVA